MDAKEVGETVTEAIVDGSVLLGKGTIWLGRVLANSAVGAAKGAKEEWKRQQEQGFKK